MLILKTFYISINNIKRLLPVVFLASFAQWWAIGLHNIETFSRFILLWIFGLILLYECENKIHNLYLLWVNMLIYTYVLYIVNPGHLKKCVSMCVNL